MRFTRHIERLHKEAQKHHVTFKFKIMKSDLASDCIVTYTKENKVSLIVTCKTKLGTALEKRYCDITVEKYFQKNLYSVLVVK